MRNIWKQNNKAFTLVELIVVITILAILGTIWFISLNSYNEYARDTVRTADLGTISRWIKLKIAEWGYAPKPENATTLTASWTTIGYQGEFSSKIWSKYWINWNLIDPLDERNYVYSVDENLYRFTVWWFLEWDEVALGYPQGVPLQNTYALEWRTLKTAWDKFGIILKDWEAVNKDTWFTDNKLDLFNTDQEYTIYFDDNESIAWTGSILSQMIPNTSCRKLYDLWHKKSKEYNLLNNWVEESVFCDMEKLVKWEWVSCLDILEKNPNYSWKNWIYSIKPLWEPYPFDVYCDMTVNSWWWTMLMSVNPDDSTWAYNSSQWLNPKYNSYLALPHID